jgi:chorismate mutase
MSAYLEQKLAELNQEIRNYPGPIARCDQHLPALLEERARLMAELQLLRDRDSCPSQVRWGHDGGRVNEEGE